MLRRALCCSVKICIRVESKRCGSSSCKNDSLKLKSHLAPAQLLSIIPVTVVKGQGACVWDTKDGQYLDFISGTGALILGHSHPTLVKAMQDQCQCLTMTSRVFQTNQLSQLTDFMAEFFNFEKILVLNTDKVEACETSLKIARLWGYSEKKIPEDEARILLACDNYWGSSFAAMSSSSDKNPYKLFGPFLPGFSFVAFNDLSELKEKLQDPCVCAFMIEPIQGAAGLKVPDKCYMAEVQKLCKENNVLLVVDEVKTGLGITGRRLCIDHDDVKPDILILGKGLSAGMMPVSAVLADEHIMDLLKPEMHNSTFGGNPLGCQVALNTLNILEKEKLWENAEKLGEILREELCKLPPELVVEVRGKGLLNGLLLNTDTVKGENISHKLAKNGVLARLHRGNFLTLIPPLIINEFQILTALKVLHDTLCSYMKS